MESAIIDLHASILRDDSTFAIREQLRQFNSRYGHVFRLPIVYRRDGGLNLTVVAEALPHHGCREGACAVCQCVFTIPGTSRYARRRHEARIERFNVLGLHKCVVDERATYYRRFSQRDIEAQTDFTASSSCDKIGGIVTASVITAYVLSMIHWLTVRFSEK